MLYVEPRGGLSMRLRTIASFYTAMREAGRGLVVAFKRDAGTTCPSARLFSSPFNRKIRGFISSFALRRRAVWHRA